MHRALTCVKKKRQTGKEVVHYLTGDTLKIGVARQRWRTRAHCSMLHRITHCCGGTWVGDHTGIPTVVAVACTVVGAIFISYTLWFKFWQSGSGARSRRFMALDIGVASITWLANTHWCMDCHYTFCIYATYLPVEARVKALFINTGKVIVTVIVYKAFWLRCGLRTWCRWLWKTARNKWVTNISRRAVALRTMVLTSAHSHGCTRVADKTDFSTHIGNTHLCCETIFVYSAFRYFSNRCWKGAYCFMHLCIAIRILITWEETAHLHT